MTFLGAGYTKYEEVVVFSNMGLGTDFCNREGLKKYIESVIMIIPGRGGGSAGGDHTLLGFFFNAPNLVVWLY